VLVLTHSSIQTFRDCHRKYDFAYNRFLKSKRPSWALIDGSNVHLALETYYGVPPSQNAKAPEQTPLIQGIITVLETLYDKETEYEEEERDLHRAIAVSLFKGYAAIYPQDEFEEYVPEVRFSVEVEHTDLPEKKFVLCGKTDAKIKQNGMPYLFETKTTSSFNLNDYLARLELDDQSDTYLFSFGRMGYPAVGILYNVLVKPKLKQNVFESAEHFHKRIEKAIMDDTKQVPEKRKYFRREMIYRSPEELAKWHAELLQTADDMYRYYPYKNPGRCGDWSGCEFKKLCEGMETDKFYISQTFVLKERQHEEAT